MIRRRLTALAAALALATWPACAWAQAAGTVKLHKADGNTNHYLASAATVNSTLVKNAAGTVFTLYVVNLNAAVRYIRFYDASSAPTCSSATNFETSLPIPAATTGAGFVLDLGPLGWAFSTGIGYCLTTGASSTDNTAVALNEIFVNLWYR